MSEHASYDSYIYIPPLPRTNIVSRDANLEANPSLETLMAVVQRVAKQDGGMVSNQYKDNAGTRHQVWLAIETPGFPRGVGINIGKDGAVLFHYDTLSGSEEAARKICTEVKQTYIVVQLLRALGKLGFTVDTREQLASGGVKSIVVSAKRYGGQRVVATIDSSGSIDTDFAGYRGQECLKDEALLHNNLRMNGVTMVTKRRRSKPDTPGAASWRDSYGNPIK